MPFKINITTHEDAKESFENKIGYSKDQKNVSESWKRQAFGFRKVAQFLSISRICLKIFQQKKFKQMTNFKLDQWNRFNGRS